MHLGCVEVLMTDGIEEVMRKVEEGRARIEADDDDDYYPLTVREATWEALISLVKSAGASARRQCQTGAQR